VLRASAGAGTIVLALLLQWIYREIVWPKYAYLGYTYRPPEMFDYILAIGIAAGIAATLPTRISKPSHLVLWVVFIVAGAPSILVPHYLPILDKSEALTISAQVGFASLLLNVLGPRSVFGRLMPRRISNPVGFWSCIFAVTAVTYAYMAVTVGLGLRAPSLTDVYDVRFEYRDNLAAAGLLGYLIPMQANVLNPVIMLRGIYSKRPLWIIGGFVGQYAIFSASGLKSVILSTPALLLFAYLFRRNQRPAGASIMWGTVGGVFAAGGLDRLFGGDAWTSISVRRFLITPGLLTGAFFHIFQPLDKAHWAYTFLSPIVDYPYSTSPPFLVGRLFFDRPELRANASLFADGYANWGFAGLVVEALVMVLALWAIDSAARGMPVAVSALIFAVPGIALANSSVFTTLLTHGMAAGIAVCLFAPRTGWGLKPKPNRAASAARPPTRHPASSHLSAMPRHLVRPGTASRR
jgi:hypothetical protein